MKIDLRSVAVSVFLFLFFAAIQPANAQNTIHVPADQPSIQAAITAAQPGDTVLVAPGTYFENLDFQGKAITVTSSDGPATTIVDAGSLGPVAIFQTNEGANSVLNGFTLQNGIPSQVFGAFGEFGGGVLIVSASPTITNNVITHNRAICGIGMEIRNGSPMIRGNTITGNTQDFGDGGCGGGGIEVTGDDSHPPAAPQIIGNTITNNSLPGGGFGGGIEVSFFASPTIQNNYIAGNSVWNSGGGIDLSGNLSTIVVQNIIVNNSTQGGGSGAGINLKGPSSAAGVIVNNTIVGNTAFDGSSGIFIDVLSPIVITNNIVVAASGQNAIVCSPFSSAFPAFSHNDVTSPGTGGQAWSSNCASNDQSNGNISADPQFVNAAGNDYHLIEGSPAIEVGDNNAPDLPQQDYDGSLRITFGVPTPVKGATVDMGVYEFVLPGEAAATLSPASLDFGMIPVGASSNPQTLTFTITEGSIDRPTISITGDFHESDNCSSAMTLGARCNIQVTFSPSGFFPTTGTLVVTSGFVSVSSTLTGQGIPPFATLSPTSVGFGNQLVGSTSAAQIVTLSNTGVLAVQISSFTLSGDFGQTNNCPVSLASGASCAVSVTFTPTTTGNKASSLIVSSSGGTAVANLSGTGAQPGISVSPASVAFGNQLLNTAAANRTITVSNPGGATLHVSSISISGDPDFVSVTDNCAGAIGTSPGGTCSIQVGFTPSAVGPAAGTLTISSDAPTGPITVALSGNGINPIATVSPSSLDFGSQGLNTSSPTQTVTLSSTGGSPLQIASIAANGDFSQTNGCLPSLNPGSSCTIQVAFRPTAAGSRTGNLIISTNSAQQPPPVTLSGNGVQSAISVSPASIAFGDQMVNTTGPSQTITVTNPGSATLHINSTLVSGDNTSLTVLTSNCGAGVAPGGNCSILVDFTPRSAGPAAATLTITSDAPTSPTTVSLSGNGVTNAVASLSTASLSFGDQLVNTSSAVQTITLSDTGSGPLQISSITVSGDFSQTNNCPASPAAMSPGATCIIQVTFHPTAAGARSGGLSITTNAPNSPSTVSLSGNGVNPSPIGAPSATSLNFGNQPVTTSSAAQTVTLSNTGNAPLQISSIAASGDFAQSNNCPASLNAASSCAIQVIFQPTAAGARSGSLSISSNSAPSVPPVSLSGTGVDYALTASPASISTRSGHQAQTSINVGALGGSYGNPVALSCANLPSGANCSFSPASVTPGAASATSTLTVNTQLSGGLKTAPGTYTITVRGSSSGLVRNTTINLTVTQ